MHPLYTAYSGELANDSKSLAQLWMTAKKFNLHVVAFAVVVCFKLLWSDVSCDNLHKKLSYRREAARRFVSLNNFLSLKVIQIYIIEYGVSSF